MVGEIHHRSTFSRLKQVHNFRSRLKNTYRSLATGDERGGVIVEFAAVSMILILLIFGVIEGGLLFRAKLALSNSTDEAVRSASISGDRGTADYEILQQILKHSADGGASIERIIVFRASDPTDGPAPTCAAGISTTGECNVYEKDDFVRPETDFGACGALDGNWCPTDRDTTFDGDLVGVAIQGSYRPIAKIFGDVGLDQEAVLPFESRGSAR